MSTIALATKMIHDCKNINSNYDFYDLVKAHTGNYNKGFITAYLGYVLHHPP